MPGKTSKPVVAKTEPVVELKTETPVVAAPAQKSGKKVVKVVEVKEVAPVIVAPIVVAPVVVAPVVAAPVVAAPAQKGGRKVAAKVVEAKETVTVVTPPVVAAPAQKGGRKAVVKVVETVVATPAQVGGKKAATKKTVAPKGEKKQVVKKAKVEKTDTAEGEDDVSGVRRVRSFKVRLPNSETFEGRFTGLTPYQAANKALSKYFRETEHPKVEISFSICESTRKSKKSVYTYVGKRHQLEVPVTYKIADGREIVKNFKNSLKKVKKSEAVTESA